MNTPRAIAAAAAVGIAASTIIAAAPALAGTADRGTYTSDYSDSFDGCGVPVAVSGTVTGNYIDQLRGSNPVPFYHDHFIDTTTYTNLDTGRSFFTVNRATHLDTEYVQVTGTIVRMSGKDSGTFSVFDSSGKLYRRQSGLSRGTFVVDTMGTTDPSDDVLLDAQFSSYGHTPSADFCADVATLTSD
ncbi:MAG: hypothetical protein QOG80_1185 [Pseudonocardiales bacterium]|jgi:hypothetical protein|nr:hypothetical protein [Pseudonocardiales bacterium]